MVSGWGSWVETAGAGRAGQRRAPRPRTRNAAVAGGGAEGRRLNTVHTLLGRSRSRPVPLGGGGGGGGGARAKRGVAPRLERGTAPTRSADSVSPTAWETPPATGPRPLPPQGRRGPPIPRPAVGVDATAGEAVGALCGPHGVCGRVHSCGPLCPPRMSSGAAVDSAPQGPAPRGLPWASSTPASPEPARRPSSGGGSRYPSECGEA